MPLAVFPKCFLDQMVSERSLTVDAWIEMASVLNVDGLEFFSGFTPLDQPDELKRLRDLAASNGLAIPMMCHSPDFTVPAGPARDREIAKQKAAITASSQLGGAYCRVLSGQKRPEISVDEGLDRAAACILECIPFAADQGVTLVLENHYKDSYWDYPEFAQKKDVFLNLLDRVGRHANFGVNFDPSNAIVAGDDPIELLEAVKDRVVTMHASDRWLTPGASLDDLRSIDAHPMQGYAPFLRHGVIGQGLNDYDKIFSILGGVGFSGWVSIEDGQDPECGMEHLDLSAKFLRVKMAAHGLQ